ncbi:MAG: hypothetical protein H8D96_07235 [Desulfobacterales bacterium]|uniref:Uncharacterized protein n=1 Tax=Candidatus Desulfatibia vada TaxID=2841696 RepID=A0A8J6NT88_9BACT|nr:hypothetical protein [Candidatus Desulfatibia vada]MBL6970958.1 hypothetical protein [Desulfobacterales bacterium]
MRNTDLYSNAHIVVAAIRVLAHQKNAPPSIEDVCQTLSFSLEQGNFICNKLEEMQIIEIVEGSYGTRLFIKNHLKIEDIPRGDKVSGLEEELKKFQSSRKNFTKEIESFQAKQAKKQKDLFAELEKKLKQGTDPK